MKIKGKVFTAQQVQSMIAGNMNMFREVIKPQPIGEFIENESWSRSIAASCGVRNPANSDIEEHAKKCSNIFSFRRENGLIVGKLAPYRVGQKIFCKETWAFFESGFLPKHIPIKKDIYTNNLRIAHKASFSDSELKFSWRWKSSKQMIQEHSRLTLLIKEIKVEKLADITPFDCVCEGIWDGRNVALGMSGKAVETFKDNWNATHKKPEEKFEASPWVWVVSCEVVK